jgi:flagellar biosynthetic protein FliP
MRAIARSKFRDCPPPAGSPRFARGTERSAWGCPAARGEPICTPAWFALRAGETESAPAWFPLLAGGTLRRGFSFIRAVGRIGTGAKPAHCALCTIFTLFLLFTLLLPAVAQETVPIPRVSVEVGAARTPQEVSTSLQILAILTLLSVAPSILLMMTAFTRIVIVLSFLKSALGTPNIPPTPVIIGLSLFLTFYVMAPTLDEINRTALQPYMRQQITFPQALERAEKPIRAFMLRQTYTEDLNLFIRLSKQPPPRTADDLPLTTLIPAFMLSELKTAFIIGFYIYIPFLVIDLIVASILLSMGMMMLPPVVVSLPAKLLVFTLANGWNVLAQALVQGFR